MADGEAGERGEQAARLVLRHTGRLSPLALQGGHQEGAASARQRPQLHTLRAAVRAARTRHSPSTQQADQNGQKGQKRRHWRHARTGQARVAQSVALARHPRRRRHALPSLCHHVHRALRHRRHLALQSGMRIL